MSDQTGGDGGGPDEDEPTRVLGSAHEGEPTRVVGATPAAGARAPWARRAPEDEEVRHSALVGFMSVPVHRRFPIRRSTLLMAAAFIGLGVVLYFNPPQSDATPATGSVIHTPDGDVFVPGAVKVTSSTTTSTPTTSTTTTTTTTRPPAATTSTSPRATTTTLAGGTATTSGSTTTTVAAGTTTTVASGAGQSPGGGAGSPRPTTTTTTTSTTVR
jgi:hypothetical protein